MAQSSAAASAGQLLDGADGFLVRRWAERESDGRTRREAMLARLATRRDGSPASAAEPLDLRGLDLLDADLERADLTGCDLRGVDLSRANLKGARLLRAKLAGAVLYRAELDGTDLSGADLAGANLEEARAQNAGLGLADLKGASLRQARLDNATLTGASLEQANLNLCSLVGARAREADFTCADLSCGDLRETDLSDAQVTAATIDRADLRHAVLGGVRGYEHASWIGADVREADFNGAYLCRRFVLDQNYLREFRDRSRWTRTLYTAWWLTSDCGRSLTRWGMWTILIAFCFAGAFRLVEVDYGDHPTGLSSLYYSVVTLTTLGYGDVVPASVGAQLIAMAEVIVGYLMLGGLLSIFSNKMARRAD